ncbi:beta strand repeat-containing protein, partial [Shewanella hanedai]
VTVTGQDLSGLADGTLTVTMNVTDLAGNTGNVTDTTVLDTTAPGTGDGENVINFLDGGDELVSDVESTSVPLSGQVAVGSTVNSITISDGTTTITVNAADITVAADGTVTVTGQDLSGLADGTLTVTMNVTDLAGNTGNVTDTTVLDTTAPGTGDGENVINFLDGGDELVSDAESTSVPLSGQVAMGSTVNSITISDGTTTITVNAADITVAADGTITVTGQDLSGLADGTLTVTMNVTDLAGNTGNVTDTTVLDTTAPGTGDGENTINFLDGGDELVSDAESTSVPLSGQVAVGSTVNSITISDGTTTITVNAADITVAADGTVTVTGQDLSGLADGTLTVTMNVTDLAGNTGNVTDTTVLDTTAPGTGDGENTINFLDGGDELVSDAESTSVPLSGQVAVGSTVNSITISDGTTTITVNAADITVAADGTVTVTGQDLSGLADGTLTVTMNVTDLAGNTGNVTDTTVLDTTAPGTGDGENVINFLDGGDELVSDVESTSVPLSGQVAVGSTVNSITISDGTTTITVNAADITVAADGTVTVTGQDFSGLADGTLSVTMNVTDLAGNTGNVTDTTVLDTTIGSPSVTIDEDINNDGFINDAELDGQIDITVALSAGTAVGDTLVVTDQAGNTLFSGPVTQAMLDSGLSVTMNPPATGTNVTVTATVTDPAGNTSSNSDTALLTNATDDSITVDEDNVASGNVLANDGSGHINVTGFTMDTNGDNVEESFAVNTNVTVAGGTLIINSDGGYSFTPAPDWNGVLPVITYTTNTGDTATLTITVDSVSDPVVANDDSYTVNEDGSIAINLLGNDVANDGGLAVKSINGVTLTGGAQNITVSNGTVVIAANGAMTFVPAANFNGTINFDY